MRLTAAAPRIAQATAPGHPTLLEALTRRRDRA